MQTTNIMNRKTDTSADPTYIKRIVREHHIQVYANSKTQMKWTNSWRDSSYKTQLKYIDNLNNAMSIY